MRLALFDFDGTITTKDSLADFTKFAVGKANYYLGLITLSPTLTAYVLHLLPNHIAKEKFITHFFKGWDVDDFRILTDRYAHGQIDKITRFKAIEKIRWHQNQGHKIIIVSASIE